MGDYVVNPEMIKFARVRLSEAGILKRGFQDAASLAGGGGGGGMPPMDPAMMGGGGGGMPPMDPAMMGGGGAPPMDPAMMGGGAPPPSGGGGGGDSAALLAKMDQMMQMMQSGAGGSAGAGGGGMLKPKVDVNVEIMQMKHMLAKLIDAAGIPISAQEMTATPEKLTQMAQQQQAGDPSAMGGGGGAIPPIDPMQGSGMPGAAMKQGSAREIGHSWPYHTSLGVVANKAAAIARVLKAGRR